MITKAKRLKSIGKFYDFASTANELDWHKNTFVFAPNAYGKTTFVTVLRSLRDDDPKLIRSRKTLGATAEPQAVIVVGGVNHVFDGSKWDRPHPDIQIFDAPFIQANVLTHEIGHEHKKSIHRIIIGEQGKQLAEALSALKAKAKAKTQAVDQLVAQFERGGFSQPIAAVISIPVEEEATVNDRIRGLEQGIKSKESEEAVRRLVHPRPLAALSFDLSATRLVLSKKLAAIHGAAEARVLAHIDRNFKDKSQARRFIRQGLDTIQAECPFCGQDLKHATDLLKAYQEFFDESFRVYQREVAEQATSLTDWNLDNGLTELASSQNANLATVRQWEEYLGETQLPDLAATVDACRSRLSTSKVKVLSELHMKQQDPNADADFASLDALAAELAALKAAVTEYNNGVASFTEKAAQYVATLPKSGIASIRVELEKLQEIRKRLTPEWKRWAAEYSAARQEEAALETEKKQTQKDLDDASKTIFDTYQNRLNELLRTLGADFAITGLSGKSDERANESYSDFGFLVLEQTVPLTSRHDEAPTFKNTLSEGDKSTLGFAFFMAALEKQPHLDKQIVVFDDPLSSLDETRREATARLLLDLSPTVKQLNVFTHKRDFLYMLCDKLPDNRTIQVRSDKKHGSKFAILDVEEDRKSAHARLVEGMGRYLEEDYEPTTEVMQGNLRKLFETVLKTKYYRLLAADIAAKHGLSALLTTLFAAKLVSEDLKPRLFDLCSVANGSHHGEIVDAAPKKLTRDELIPLIREALELVYKV